MCPRTVLPRKHSLTKTRPWSIRIKQIQSNLKITVYCWTPWEERLLVTPLSTETKQHLFNLCCSQHHTEHTLKLLKLQMIFNGWYWWLFRYCIAGLKCNLWAQDSSKKAAALGENIWYSSKLYLFFIDTFLYFFHYSLVNRGVPQGYKLGPVLMCLRSNKMISDTGNVGDVWAPVRLRTVSIFCLSCLLTC